MDALETAGTGDKPTDKKTKLALCLWISFCAVGFVWFISKVLRGRRQMRYNFDNIEEQLRRIQNTIEERQNRRAINGDTKEEEDEDTKEEIADEVETVEASSKGGTEKKDD